MRIFSFTLVVAAAAAVVIVGTYALDRSSQLSVGTFRPERSIGDPAPASPARKISPSWTPSTTSRSVGVTMTLSPSDSRIARFADFPILIPRYLPKDVKISKTLLLWDPATGRRTLQFALQGGAVGMISERRLRRQDPAYPKGILLRTVRQADGNAFRSLQSGPRGVALSIACSLNVSDEDLVRMYNSLQVRK
jgi:hypothetical protein